MLLAERGIAAQLLDSDEVRKRITPHPTYSPEERDWFYELLVLIAELLVANGVNCLIAATAPRRSYREGARRRIGRFAEVYVVCPPEVCWQRDGKGLWGKAQRGEIKTLPGAGAEYEPPDSPEVCVDTTRLAPLEAAQEVVAQLDRRDFFKTPETHL